MNTQDLRARTLADILAVVEATPARKPDALAELDARLARPTTSANKAQRINRFRAKIVAIDTTPAPAPTTPAPATEAELIAKYMAMPMNRLEFAARRARKPEVKAAIERVMCLRENGITDDPIARPAPDAMIQAMVEWLTAEPGRKAALAAALRAA